MEKYKNLVIIFFLISVYIVSFVDAKVNSMPLLGKIIYIDPGHGGLDPGAVYKDKYESKINLQISEVLSETLGNMGAIVYMTRYGDYDLALPNALNRKRSDLSRRGNIINRSGCDLYISIHLNSIASSTWSGAQVFYDEVNDKNIFLAKIMQEELKKHLNSQRKYKKITDMYLHKRIKPPGVLIEVGFLSNPNDRYLLAQKSYQQKLSNAIASGVVKFLN